jgi:hypothetical protein
LTIGVDTCGVVGVCEVAVVACFGIGAACGFISIADSIAVGVLRYDTAVAIAYVALTFRVDTCGSICSVRVVVASEFILTSCNFIGVANAISIGILYFNPAIAIASLTVAISEDA